MKTKRNLFSVVLLLLFASSVLFMSCKADEKKEADKETVAESETTYGKIEVETTCACESSWFPHSQTPAPKEGKGSPFDTSNTTNCMFHQWSWQKFLWLTMPDGDQPLFLNQSKIIQVDDLMNEVTVPSGTYVVLQDTEQAGPDNGILKTNTAYNTGSKEQTVYYSIHTSPIMLKTAKKFEAELAAGTLKPDNLEVFPVGSLELKVSWVSVAAIPDGENNKNYFITTANLSTDGGKTFTPTKMALLGMHVVGVVENHPEFIWATFEHNDIAPNYNWQEGKASSTTDKLLFAKGDMKTLDGITYTKNVGPVTPHKAYDLFQYGTPQDASGFMKGTSQDGAKNFTNIQDINTCVAAKLGDVWKNYFYNGSLWLDMDNVKGIEKQAKLIADLQYNIANATTGSSARGSLNNANVSMETFTQTFTTGGISSIKADNLTNCFSCHAGVSFSGNTGPIYLSHIFDAHIYNKKGKTRDEINTLKDEQQTDQIKHFLKKSSK